MTKNNNIEVKESVARGKLEFEDCYSLYKFIEAISLLVDEVPLTVDSDNNKLVIKFMDAPRVCLIETIFSNPKQIISTSSLKSFLKSDKKSTDIISKYHYNIDIEKSGKQTININDLKNILKVKKNDEKNVNIIFEDPYKILVEKESTSLGVIKKNLLYLFTEIEDISIETLNNTEYPSTIEVSQKLLNDFFYEAGVYSEVIGIEINKKGIHFTEEGVIGDSDIFYESKLLNVHNISTKIEQGYYSLTYLNLVKPIVNIMEETDTIKIELKTDHPLRVSIKFDKIGAEITYYLACRVVEVEFNDDKDEF